MSKNRILAMASLLIMLIMFNIILFLAPIKLTLVFWVCYIFTTIAFLLQIVVTTIAFGKAYTLKSKFLGFPIFYIGFVYLILQLISCAVFITLPNEKIWLPIIVNVLILGFSALSLISTEVGRDEITRIEDNISKKVFYIKSLQLDVEMLIEQASDEAIKNELRNLVGAIRYSDPMSNESLKTLENKLEEKVLELKSAVSSNDTRIGLLIKDINLLITERNKKCKILK